MMKTKHWIFILMASMLAMACSDQTRKTHTITGKVFFKDSMEPMSEILLSIYQDNGQDGFQLDILGGNQLSAADGGYIFEIQPFKNGDASDIIISSGARTSIDLAFTTQNFTLPIVFERIDPAPLLESESLTYDIIGEPFGFLEIEFKGNTDLFVGDQVDLIISGNGYQYETPLQVADNLNQVYTYPVRGDVKTTIEWESRIGGLVTMATDSIYCPNKQLTRFRINL